MNSPISTTDCIFAVKKEYYYYNFTMLKQIHIRDLFIFTQIIYTNNNNSKSAIIEIRSLF